MALAPRNMAMTSPGPVLVRFELALALGVLAEPLPLAEFPLLGFVPAEPLLADLLVPLLELAPELLLELFLELAPFGPIVPF